MAEDGEEEASGFLERSARATRGKRMTKLLDEEVELDDQFWNQDALKEEEDDVNYEEEAEVADMFDSDFDNDEPEPEENAENEAVEREKKNKKLLFPGKPMSKKKNKKKELRKLDEQRKNEKHEEDMKMEKHEQENHEDLEGSERSIRKSTRTSVIVRQAEREAIRAALQATRHPVKKKKEGEEKRMTQEEMLLEAAQTGSWHLYIEVRCYIICAGGYDYLKTIITEIMNLRNLERVLAREEEVKKRAIVHKETYTGPQVRYHSRDGKSYLEFCNGMTFNSELNTSPSPYPEKELCVVTGLPAKYRDPKTGLPYATMDAFKAIRERHLKEENDKKKKNMDIGPLKDLLSDEGFSSKRRRSTVARTSYQLGPHGHKFQSYGLG